MLFQPGHVVTYRLLLAIALATTSWLTLTPSPLPLPLDHGDKLAHAGAFLLLAFLSDASWPPRPIGWWSLALLALYGAGIEIAQHFVSNRSMSAADLLANLTGLAFYALLIGPWLRHRQSLHQQ